MAGFLTHIAERLGAPKGALRPRTPSLFEPVATAASGPAAAGTTVERPSLASPFEYTDEVDAPAVATSPPATGRVLPPQGRQTGSPVVAPDADRRADPLPEAHGSLPVTRVAARGPRRQPQAPPPAEPMADPEMEAARDAPEPTHTSAAAIRPARIVPQTQEMRGRQVGEAPATEQDDARSVAVSSDAARSVSRRSDAGETVADDRRDAVRAVVDATTRPTTSVIGILQTPVRARIASAPLLSPPAAQRSEPTVHVTIGRVEVRALAATPSDRPRPEGPSPVMSLEEYLRTRAR